MIRSWKQLSLTTCTETKAGHSTNNTSRRINTSNANCTFAQISPFGKLE